MAADVFHPIILLMLVIGLAGAPVQARAPGPGAAAPALGESQAAGFSGAAAGASHTCALTDGGGVKCWGNNDSGQLGDGTHLQRSAAVQTTGLESGVIALAAGAWHTCAITAGGGVMCWGLNHFGQLGDGTTSERLEPTPVSGLDSGVVGLKAGAEHTCALLASGGVMCWGSNEYGQLGDGTGGNSSTPVEVTGLSEAAAGLAVGGWHSCIRTVSGSAQCWGANASGQLGNGQQIDSPSPVSVLGLPSGVNGLEAGAFHTCAQTRSGQALCWGNNDWAQLGDGTYETRLAPTLVIGLAGVTHLAPGYYRTCVILSGGGVKCWGTGELGDGQSLGSSEPVGVFGLTSGAVALTAGWEHTCAAIAGGGLRCWGQDYDGQLGIGTMISRNIPADVIGLAPEVVAASAWMSSCAATTDGKAFCWGENWAGQLGDGSTNSSARPVEVTGLAGATQMASGRGHNCALTLSDEVKCWGDNFAGQLGNGATESSPIPVDVLGLGSPATGITAGENHTCALTSLGGVLCWGENSSGQLGDGTTASSATPVGVAGLESGVIAVGAGLRHTCALTSGRGVQCWGDNFSGQLGDGTTENRLTPVEVSGLTSGAAGVTAGFDHTCAWMINGAAQCWGSNHFGQLGDGTTEDRLEPTPVSGLGGDALTLAAGAEHTCAIVEGGRAQCWGSNGYGRLGDGGVADQFTPTDVAGLSAEAAILAGSAYHTCAVLDAGRMKCWGNDQFGQLGLGTTTRRLTPVEVFEAAPVRLWPNAITGQPGSIFSFTGLGFPPGSLATATVNGTVLSDALQVLPGGGFIFFLDTTGAEAEVYQVTVSANPSAAVTIVLDPASSLRPLEGGGLILDLPAGIARQAEIFFYPLAFR